MKKFLFLIVTLVALLAPIETSAFSLFSDTKEIKEIGGYFSCAYYKQQMKTTASFVGYVEFTQTPSGNLMAKGDVPPCGFLLLKLRLDPVDRVDIGRRAKIMAHCYPVAESCSHPNCKECNKTKPKGMQNMITIAESSDTLYLEAWYPITSVEELGFTLMGRSAIKGERDFSTLVTIPVSKVSVGTWIQDPSAAGPISDNGNNIGSTRADSSGSGSTGSVSPFEALKPAKTEYDPIKKTVTLIGKCLIIRLVGMNGGPFCGDGKIKISTPANNRSVLKTYQNGMLLKNGCLIVDNILEIKAGPGTCLQIDAGGFSRYDRDNDTITLYGGGN